MLSDNVYFGNQPRNKHKLREKIKESVYYLNTYKRETIYNGFISRVTNSLLKNRNRIK